jgi:hypothetical protein
MICPKRLTLPSGPEHPRSSRNKTPCFRDDTPGSQPQATADGKIPVYDHWRGRRTAGETGLDALDLSALHVFLAEQAALDAEIKARNDA